MIQLQSFGILLCTVLACGFLARMLWAFQQDRLDDYHLMHGPNDGCLECEDK